MPQLDQPGPIGPGLQSCWFLIGLPEKLFYHSQFDLPFARPQSKVQAHYILEPSNEHLVLRDNRSRLPNEHPNQSEHLDKLVRLLQAFSLHPFSFLQLCLYEGQCLQSFAHRNVAAPDFVC